MLGVFEIYYYRGGICEKLIVLICMLDEKLRSGLVGM